MPFPPGPLTGAPLNFPPPGSSGGAGCSNVLIVRSLADLPAPVAGVIPLPGSTFVRPCGQVDLEGNVLSVGEADTVIGGSHGDLDGFVTDNAAAALLSNVPGIQIATLNVGLRNDGGAALEYDGAAGSGAVILTGTVVGGLRFGRIFDAGFVSVYNTVGIGLAGGIVLEGSNGFVAFNEILFPDPAGPAFVGLLIAAGSDMAALQIIDSGFILTDPAQVGLSIDPTVAVAVPPGQIIGNVFIGPGTPLAGITPETPGFRFENNVGLADSVVLGCMSFTGNLGGAPTAFPGVGAFVPVGTGSPLHPLYVAAPINERTSVAGATTATQVLVYDGLVATKLVVTASLSVQSPFLVAKGFSLRILQNGVPIPDTSMDSQTGGLVTSAGNCFAECAVVAAPGDVFQIELANLTDGTDLIVSSATMIAKQAA
jgi:hypothetical protein